MDQSDKKEEKRDGIVNADGKMPIIVSGGLIAKGHPVSATGLAQNIGGAGSTITTAVLRKMSG